MYYDRWLRFADWATGKGFDPLCPTATQIAAFVYELFDTHGLSPQIIKGSRSCCLASVLSRTGKAAEVQAKTISDMIMSMELQRPRFTPVLPQWDLCLPPPAMETAVEVRYVNSLNQQFVLLSGECLL